LHGDLEYIPYIWDNPSDAFHHSSEMINKIIAGQLGFSVTMIIAEPAAAIAQEEKATSEQSFPQLMDTESSSEQFFTKMRDALLNHNLSEASQAYSDGVDAIRKGQLKVDEITWACVYPSMPFRGGENSSFDELKAIEAANPQNPIPAAQVGHCLMRFREFRAAAARFQKAASLDDQHKANYLLRAVEALKELKNFSEAETILRSIIASQANVDGGVLSALYDLLKLSGKHLLACSVAELCLHKEPQNGFLRYSLGLDYHRIKQNELFLYHYDLLRSIPKPDGGSFHNFALACSLCDLPIASVRNYKKAIEAGETLSVSNLATQYLDSGFLDEAQEILKAAIATGEYVTEVPRSLASAAERDEAENEKMQSLLLKAREQQLFLVNLGSAFLDSVPSNLSGVWRFPFGEISLTLHNNLLTGELTTEITDNLLSAFMRSSLAGQPYDDRLATRTEHYQFKGLLTGRVCKATILCERNYENSKSPNRLSPEDKGAECYIAFSESSQTSTVYEIADDSFTKHYEISKLT
jgi:tetratricopeptide (TPR) repeat protein